MRYILNFNRQAAQDLGTKNTAIELTTGATKRRGKYTLITANTGTGPAFSPESPGSDRFKVRLSADEAREVGIKGAQRYILERRGASDRYYLVPHSKVRSGQRVRIDGPAITVSLTERT